MIQSTPKAFDHITMETIVTAMKYMYFRGYLYGFTGTPPIDDSQFFLIAIACQDGYIAGCLDKTYSPEMNYVLDEESWALINDKLNACNGDLQRMTREYTNIVVSHIDDMFNVIDARPQKKARSAK